MASEKTSFHVAQVAHGAVELSGAIGGRVREHAEFLPLRAATLSGPAGRPLVAQDVEAEVELLNLDDDVAAGAKATLTFTLKEAGGGEAVVAVAGMRRAGVEWDFRSAPHLRRVRFVHEGPMTNSPISVTV